MTVTEPRADYAGAPGAVESHVQLPEPPHPRAAGEVAVWSEPLTIDSYLPDAPDRHPAFFETRVYQGSSGRVYPLPFHERIAAEKQPHHWQAVHLENDWLRLVILPELGGRLQIAVDKVSGHDMFYRNNVIKPALVGLAGPWISGGVEFNWPQHHRPATFLPTDVSVEHEADGAVTVWCSDHDPFARMKGMHGIRVRPGSSRIEARVRLYNRSEVRETFLWWANVAAAVNDHYQSFFPDDVRWVADHAKRAVVAFPEADRAYYGVDYPARVDQQHPDAARIDWYRNIPVPTSYMAIESAHEFFGGYDHGRRAGFVHWASRDVSPGKKQWTWGNAPFGWAWDRNLTDTDGPYVELMAGVYTDNQPDFAYLMPGETKTFSQAWYPISGFGPPQSAGEILAGRIDVVDGVAHVGVIATERLPAVEIRLRSADDRLSPIATVALEPATPFTAELSALGTDDVLEVLIDGRCELVAAGSRPGGAGAEPESAVEPPLPADVPTIDELVHIARYLEQYRHATRSSVPYWHEVLERDPGEIRARVGLGALAYGRGEYAAALVHFEAALARTTRWAPTPHSGETHYRAGLALVRLGRDAEAAERFARAGWDAAYAAPAGLALARLHCRAGELALAERVLRGVLRVDPEHLQAADLLAVVLLERGCHDAAHAVLAETLARDPLDAWAVQLSGGSADGGAGSGTADATIALDVALEYRAAGFDDRALDALRWAAGLAEQQPSGQVAVGPLIAYHRAAILAARGDEAMGVLAAAIDRMDTRNCFPSRLDDLAALDAAVRTGYAAPRAAALRGLWLYDRRRYADAQASWRLALSGGLGDHDTAVVERGLAIAAYNVDHDLDAAWDHYARARRACPGDPKLLAESDRLAERRGMPAEQRILRLERDADLIEKRDDLLVAYAELLTSCGRAGQARRMLAGRTFQPWEGGEGQVLAAWDRCSFALVRDALGRGAVEEASALLDQAQEPPLTLGEGRHPLANVAELELLLGDTAAADRDDAEAAVHWEAAAASVADFARMALTPYSVQTVYSIDALRRLGREDAAERLIAAMDRWLDEYATTDARIDYFATSLPTMLLFIDHPNVERNRAVAEMRAALAERMRPPSA